MNPTPPSPPDEQRTAEVDAIVEAAANAAREFRELDQEQVDTIVEAMVRAGLRAAAELAAVAIEETGFGVFEDKVVKNYVATECGDARGSAGGAVVGGCARGRSAAR